MMRHFLYESKGLRLAIGLLLALLCLGQPAMAQDQGPWLVTQVQGEVWLKSPDGATTSLQQGDQVGPGTAVLTGGSGRVTLSRAGTAMTLSPNGETEIPADSDQDARTTIFQRLGALLLKVDKRPEQHFEVDTPFLAAVVKGTTFTVSVDNGGSAVHVVEGAVEVGAFDSGEVALVRPGQTARVSSQPGSGLTISGLGAPAGKSDDNEQRSQNNAASEAEQSAAGPASQNMHEARQQSATAAAGKAKGLIIEKAIGWDGIDISAVSDGFVAAVPSAAASALELAASAGGGAAGTVADVATTAVTTAGSGIAAVGQATGGSVAATASGATAAASGALSSTTAATSGIIAGATTATSGIISGATTATSGIVANTVNTASNVVTATTTNLGSVIQNTTATVTSQNHGSAVSSVVNSLLGGGKSR